MDLKKISNVLYKSIFIAGAVFLTGCSHQPRPDKYTFFDRQFKPDVYYYQIDFNRFLKKNFADTDNFINKVKIATGKEQGGDGKKLSPFVFYK